LNNGVRSIIVASTLSSYSPRHGPTPSHWREPFLKDHDDRLIFLSVLAEGVERFNWSCHAYCLITKHYYLVVETPDGNLSKGIRQLSGLYTQASNRRHRNDAIIAAYAASAYSYREIAAHFALHLATVGRIMRARIPEGEISYIFSRSTRRCLS
jgi:hypothetical protein